MIFDRQDGVLPGRIISIDLGTGEPAEPVFPRDPKTASPNDAAVGDIIWFGHYPGISAAEDSQDPLPVPWLVLDRTSEDLLLISRDALDSRPYHGEFRDVVWEDCDLRKWLNGEFLHSFFSAAEQKRTALRGAVPLRIGSSVSVFPRPEDTLRMMPQEGAGLQNVPSGRGFGPMRRGTATGGSGPRAATASMLPPRIPSGNSGLTAIRLTAKTTAECVPP